MAWGSPEVSEKLLDVARELKPSPPELKVANVTVTALNALEKLGEEVTLEMCKMPTLKAFQTIPNSQRVETGCETHTGEVNQITI